MVGQREVSAQPSPDRHLFHKTSGKIPSNGLESGQIPVVFYNATSILFDFLEKIKDSKTMEQIAATIDGERMRSPAVVDTPTRRSSVGGEAGMLEAILAGGQNEPDFAGGAGRRALRALEQVAPPRSRGRCRKLGKTTTQK